MSSIEINDCFDELKDENKRLENELIFANKCLNVLNKMRINLNEIFSLEVKSKQLIFSEEVIHIFKGLDEEYKKLWIEKLQLNPINITENIRPLNVSTKQSETQQIISKPNEDHNYGRVLPNTGQDNNEILEELQIKTEVNDEINEQFVDSMNTSTKVSPNNQTMSSLTHKNLIINKSVINSSVLNSSTPSLTTTITSAVNVSQLKQNNQKETTKSIDVLNTKQSVGKGVSELPILQRFILPSRRALLEDPLPSKSNPIKYIQIEANHRNYSKVSTNNIQSVNKTVCSPPLPQQSKPLPNNYGKTLSGGEQPSKSIPIKIIRFVSIPNQTNPILKSPLIPTTVNLKSTASERYNTPITPKANPITVVKTNSSTKTSNTYESELINDKLYYKCCLIVDCNESFETIKELDRHQMESHPDIDRNGLIDLEPYEKNFKCSYSGCDKTFLKKKVLREHQLSVHAEGLNFKCDHPGCGKSFKNHKILYCHRRFVHSNLPRFVCDEKDCTYTSKSKFNLNNHYVNKHLNDRPFVCDFIGCDKRFKSKRGLDLHLRIHSNEIPIVCPIDGCAKHIKSYQLREHLLVHSKGVQFCDVWGCPFECKFKFQLNMHKELQHSERNHVCSWPGCEKRFQKKVHLSNHMRRCHIDDRKYLCSWEGCPFRSHFMSNIITHMRTHTKEKPYICDWPGCQYRCSMATNLKIHQETHIKHEPPVPQQSEALPNNDVIEGALIGGQQPSKSIPIKVIVLKPNETNPLLKTPLIPNAALLERISSQRDNSPIDLKFNPLTEVEMSGSTETTDTYESESTYVKLYIKCSLIFDCSESFETIEELDRHQMESHQLIDRNELSDSERYEKCFECEYDLCGQVFNQKLKILQHITTVHMKRKFICDFANCGKMFLLKERLRTHQIRVHAEGLNCKCDHLGCGKMFKNNKNLYEHKRNVHINGPLLKCDYNGCTYSSKLRKHLKSHQSLTHSNERPFVCDVNGCDKRFKTRKALDLHLCTHQNKMPVLCPVDGCGLLVNSDQLETHILIHSKDGLSCDWKGCQFKCKLKAQLKAHKQLTHNKKGNYIYVCNWPRCNKRFKERDHLSTHVNRVHLLEKKYLCKWPGCKFRTHFMSCLTTHMRTHTKEKPYVCEYPGCEYRCAFGPNLKKHQKVHQNN